MSVSLNGSRTQHLDLCDVCRKTLLGELVDALEVYGSSIPSDQRTAAPSRPRFPPSRTPSPDKPHRCQLCRDRDRDFSTTHALQSHYASAHSTTLANVAGTARPELTCKVEGYGYTNAQAFTQHVRRAHGN